MPAGGPESGFSEAEKLTPGGADVPEPKENLRFRRSWDLIVGLTPNSVGREPNNPL